MENSSESKLPKDILDVFVCNDCSFLENQNVFYGYGEPTNHEVMWIFHNPGGNSINQKAKQDTKDMDPKERAAFWRNDLKGELWKYKLVFTELLNALNTYGFIDGLPTLEQYKEGRWEMDEAYYENFIQRTNQKHSTFFDMIYVTDIMKCKGYKDPSQTLVTGSSYRENCTNRFLSLELENLHKLKLIMAFGKAWEGIQQYFKNKIQLLAYPSTLEYTPDQNKISESHSSIWYNKDEGLYIISMAHVANNSNGALINSYTGPLVHPVEGSIPTLSVLKKLDKYFQWEG